jgi:hypothetical protein
MPSVKVKKALSIEKISRVHIIPTREIMNHENSMEGRKADGGLDENKRGDEKQKREEDGRNEDGRMGI